MKIIAAVITHNRLALLQECIEAIRKQTYPADEIIVVNNASTDGTTEWLNEQKDIIAIHQENLGSGGGQNRAFKEAYARNANWVWTMDDDTIPTATALEKFCEYIKSFSNKKIGFLASQVLWIDDSLHLMNKPAYFWRKRKYEAANDDNYKEEAFIKVDVASFVSCLFSMEAVRNVGFPNEHFFIWLDDIEYTSRFKHYENFYIRDSIVYHKTKENLPAILSIACNQPAFKVFYGIRNFVYFYKQYNKPFLFAFLIKFFAKTILQLITFRAKLQNVKACLKGIALGWSGKLSESIKNL